LLLDVIDISAMSSWLNNLLSKKTVDHRATFLCKLLARTIDEATYEQVRHRLENCSGVETRVRITAEGWMSGSKRTSRHVPMEFYPIESVEALTVDSIHTNVLICVIRCFGSGGSSLQHSKSPTAVSSNSPASISDLPFQIIAYKFENDALPRRYVECFGSITGRTSGTSGERSSKKKSRFGKKKAAKIAFSAPVGVESTEDAPVDSARHKSLLPGRPATAAVGTLAVDRWTARDRLTPRLFASASLDDLLGADDIGATRQRTVTKKQVLVPVVRSISYEGRVDEADPADENIEYTNHARFEADNKDGGDFDGVDDLDEDAAEAGADFWKDMENEDASPDVDKSLPGFTVRQFNRSAIPADVVFRRPLTATITAWSSMDNITDRRSTDNWSSGGDSSDFSGGELELVRCRDVGVTARFPAATDHKSRPERMDYFRCATSAETKAIIGNDVEDAQCQVDMPRLRAELSDITSTGDLNNNSCDVRNSGKKTREPFVNKMAFSDEESNDGLYEDDDDSWDFGSDDGQSTLSTKAVVR